MRDTSVRQSVRIASDYCRLQLEEGKPHFLFGEELEKNTSTLEEALFHEDGSPKGSQAISRNWTARFRAVPWDVAIPLLFVRAVEIISNEITDRNNGIEKLEKKSFFFFFVSEKWSVALVRWQMIPNELNDHEKRSILSKEERDFSDTSIITLIKGWWIGRIGEIEGFTRVIWFNLRDGFCCLAMAAVNGIFGFVRYCE